MKLTLNPDYASLKEEMIHLGETMSRRNGEVVHDGRNLVMRIRFNDITLVAKRFKRVNLFQQVAYTFFRTTKAYRAYHCAREFRRRGFDTPREVAFLEEPRHGLFSVGYFVSEDCPYPPAFPALVAADHYDDSLAEAIARLVAEMHLKGIMHGDLNLGNFLYQPTEEGYRLSVVDTNRSRFFADTVPDHLCIANLCTLTHRRDLYLTMVAAYSRARRWDEEATVAKALAALDAFEKKHERKQRIKQLLKLSHK